MIRLANALLSYFTLEGRMNRAVFIRVCLFYSLVMLVLMTLGLINMKSSGIIDHALQALARGDNPQTVLNALQPSPWEKLLLLGCYFTLLPGIVRRLKDLGWNPFWGSTALYFHTCFVTLAALIGLNPDFTGDWLFGLVETILLTLLTLLHGKAGTNTYGPDPLTPKKKPHEIPDATSF